MPPALNSLWGEWEAVVSQVVPFLKGAGLHWFGDAALKGYATPYGYYRYGDPQADHLAGGGWPGSGRTKSTCRWDIGRVIQW